MLSAEFRITDDNPLKSIIVKSGTYQVDKFGKLYIMNRIFFERKYECNSKYLSKKVNEISWY